MVSDDFHLSDIIGPKRYSTFGAWRELQPKGWQRAIHDAAVFPYYVLPQVLEQRRIVAGLLDALHDQEPQRFLELDSEINRLAYLSLGVGAVLGYALAHTWPAGIEDLDGWIDRALAMVGEWGEL